MAPRKWRCDFQVDTKSRVTIFGVWDSVKDWIRVSVGVIRI